MFENFHIKIGKILGEAESGLWSDIATLPRLNICAPV